MKKFHKTKKLLALLLGMILTIGAVMPVAAAAVDGNLEISGLTNTEAVTVTAYQVLQYNGSTGAWELTDWAETALGDQAAAALTALSTEDNSNKAVIAKYLTILADAADAANVAATVTTTASATSATLETTELGSYLVICTSQSWTYTNMLVNNYNSVGEGNNILTVGRATAKGVHNNVIDKKEVAAGQTYVAVGDVIEYTVSGTFPYFQGYDKPKFTITDTMSDNLVAVTTGADGAFTDADITVTVDGVDVAFGTAYTVTANENGFVISFQESWLNENAATYAGKAFTITYQGLVTGYVEGNAYTNTVSSSIKTNNEEEPPSDDVTATSYTAAIKLQKQNEGGDKLEGAEFILQAEVAGEQKYVKLTDTDMSFVDSEEDATVFTTNEEGVVEILGLDADYTYTLIETVAPSGYALEKTTPTITFTAADPADGTYTATLAGANSAWTNQNAADAAAKVLIELTDARVGALPATGGTGVIILTVVGTAMMAVFGGVLVMMKKKKN